MATRSASGSFAGHPDRGWPAFGAGGCRLASVSTSRSASPVALASQDPASAAASVQVTGQQLIRQARDTPSLRLLQVLAGGLRHLCRGRRSVRRPAGRLHSVAQRVGILMSQGLVKSAGQDEGRNPALAMSCLVTSRATSSACLRPGRVFAAWPPGSVPDGELDDLDDDQDHRHRKVKPQRGHDGMTATS